MVGEQTFDLLLRICYRFGFVLDVSGLLSGQFGFLQLGLLDSWFQHFAMVSFCYHSAVVYCLVNLDYASLCVLDVLVPALSSGFFLFQHSVVISVCSFPVPVSSFGSVPISFDFGF